MQTNLTPCIDNIIELAVSYFKIMLKTALKHVTMRLMSFWQRLRSPELVQNRRTPWTLPCMWICDPSKSTSLFRTLIPIQKEVTVPAL